MATHNLHASSDFLNQLDWQLRRLSLYREILEDLTVSLRDLQDVLEIMAQETVIRR